MLSDAKGEETSLVMKKKEIDSVCIIKVPMWIDETELEDSVEMLAMKNAIQGFFEEMLLYHLLLIYCYVESDSVEMLEIAIKWEANGGQTDKHMLRFYNCISFSFKKALRRNSGVVKLNS
ncbi:hypothetical protein Tco_1386797 [Tanacetum coccineum]